MQVWIFGKEGFLSVADSPEEMEQMKAALKVEPKKAELTFLE